MAAPTILNSTDVGAPALSGEDGKMYDVLKWALPLLGWTIEFDDAVNFKIVFRNSTALGGTGSYLRVVDKNVDHSYTAVMAQVQAYQSMSDIDTGVFQTPAGIAFVGKSGALDATARKYRIWGDAYRFLISVWCGTDIQDDRTCVHWFGDLKTLDPLDGCFMVRVGTVASTTYGTLHPLANAINSTSAGLDCVRNRAGDSGPTNAGFWGINPSSNTTSPTPGVTGNVMDPTTGDVKFSRMLISDGTMVRGYFPGLYLPHGAWLTTYGNFVSVPDCETPDGTHSLQLVTVNRSTSIASSPAGLLIDETDGWGAV